MMVLKMQTPIINGKTPASPLKTAEDEDMNTRGRDDKSLENRRYLLRDHHINKFAKPSS